MTLHQKSGRRIKTPSSKLAFFVSSCWEKNFICDNAHKFFILSLVFLKLLIVSVAFFLGHPVYPRAVTKQSIDCTINSLQMCPMCSPFCENYTNGFIKLWKLKLFRYNNIVHVKYVICILMEIFISEKNYNTANICHFCMKVCIGLWSQKYVADLKCK